MTKKRRDHLKVNHKLTGKQEDALDTVYDKREGVAAINTKGTKKALELLPDDDIAALSPMGVDAGTVNDKTPKVACLTCELIGPYAPEDIEVSGDVTFQVMRMTECGHGIVFGCLNEKVHEKISTARTLQRRFTALAKAGDASGAKRAWKKLNCAIKAVKIRQKTAWGHNKHKTDLPAIPELTDAT